MTRDAAALREARKRRLAEYAQQEEGRDQQGDSGQSQVEAQAETITEPTQQVTATTQEPAPVVVEPQETVEAPEAPATVEASVETVVEEPAAPVVIEEEAPKELTAMVTPLDRVEKDAAIDLTLFQHDEVNPHWVVFANGEPVAKVCLADQSDPDSIRSLFVSDSYAESLQKAFRQAGLVETLSSISARSFASAVDASEAMETMRAKITAELEDSYRLRKAQAGEELLSSLGLVLEAMKNNFIVGNPLKEALYNGLTQLGIQDSVGVIEAAFSEAGSEFFDTAIQTAKEWSEYAPEAYAQLEARIKSMGHFVPKDEAPVMASVREAAVQDFPVNVPLETSGEAYTSDKQRLRESLGLGMRRGR